MYKLSVKIKRFLVALVLCAGAVIVVPPLPFVAGGNSLHYSVHALIIIGSALIFALLLFERGSKLQKFQVFLTILTATCLYGTLGNVFYHFWKIEPGDMLDFSWAQVILMNLAGILTTFALFKLEPFDSFSAGGLERLQKNKPQEGEEPQRVGDTSFEAAGSAADFMKAGASKLKMGSSKTDLKAAPGPAAFQKPSAKDLSSVESAQAIMTPSVEIDLDAADEMLSTPLNPSSAPSRPGAPATPAGPGDKKGAPAAGSATGNRLQAQRRRNTSTFTKLQALSASGTGSVAKQPEKEAGAAAGGDLRSLLDRLDTEPEDSGPTISEELNEQSLAPKEIQPLQAPEEIRIDVLFAEIEKSKKVSPAVRPLPAAGTPSSSTAAPAKTASPSQEPNRTVAPAAKEASPARVTATNDSARQPAAASAAQALPKPAAPAAETPKLASLLDRVEALAEDEPIAESGRDYEDSERQDQLPGEAESGGLLSKRFMELSEDEEEPLAKAEAKAEPEPVKEAEAEPEQEEKLFSQGVDSEIDDIFSNLAPAEAQKEISREGSRPLDGSQSLAPDEAEDVEPTVAERQEIKSVSSDLGPAQKRQEEEAPGEELETLFGESIDEDIDDIFSSLAPADAQKTVDDVFKSKQVKEEAKPEPAVKVAAEEVEASREETSELAVPKVSIQSAGGQKEEVQEEVEEETPLFKLGDADVDDIFAGITSETQMEVSPETLARIKQGDGDEQSEKRREETGEHPAVKQHDASPKSASQTGDMPAITPEQAAKLKAQVDKSIQGMVDETEDEDEPEVEQQAAPAESPEAAQIKKELKEFGKLSVKSAAAPKPSGDNVGTMKTIGKLLIDTQAVENIIKAGEQRKLGSGLSTARIISSARGQGITELLNKIDQYEGVFGSLIVGHDGLVMASTLKQGWDKDMMGALSTALLSTSNLTTKKLEIGKLRQMVMLTRLNGTEKTTVLTDVDVGILAVFVEETQIDKIDGLLDIIHKTIHG